MPYEAPPQLAEMSLFDIAKALEERRLPPIEKWNPEQEIDSRMHIAADGTWFHDGTPINRRAMVRAFSSLLLREESGRHVLLTPQCRQPITVEDAAFVAVDMQEKDGTLVFRLNTDELVVAGPDNPLRAEGDAETPAIYLAVRHGCKARINRSTWLQLVEAADFSGEVPSATSLGATFALVPQ